MGRKPQGDRAMTDAERQRRRRQRLREAKAELGQAEADSVTDELSRKVERLQKANKRLREDARGWEQMYHEREAQVQRQRAEAQGLEQDIRRLTTELDKYRAKERDSWVDNILSVLNRPTVSKIFREFSLKYHPDRGGSDEQMRVVNEMHAALLALLGKK
jgi:chromosome segregation ATPase